MADKDDDFMEGDEAAGGESKEGKAKGRFAPAMLLQILKWVAIGLGAIVVVTTISIIVFSIFSGNSNKENERIEESPEYANVVPILEWFPNLGEMRGVTADEERHTFIISPQLGYEEKDAVVLAELVGKQVQLTDMLLTWLSSQSAKYLIDIKNREEIRETIRAEINKMITKPIEDVRFTAFQILDF